MLERDCFQSGVFKWIVLLGEGSVLHYLPSGVSVSKRQASTRRLSEWYLFWSRCNFMHCLPRRLRVRQPRRKSSSLWLRKIQPRGDDSLCLLSGWFRLHNSWRVSFSVRIGKDIR